VTVKKRQIKENILASRDYLGHLLINLWKIMKDLGDSTGALNMNYSQIFEWFMKADEKTSDGKNKTIINRVFKARGFELLSKIRSSSLHSNLDVSKDGVKKIFVRIPN